jgi:hypothetical protein
MKETVRDRMMMLRSMELQEKQTLNLLMLLISETTVVAIPGWAR